MKNGAVLLKLARLILILAVTALLPLAGMGLYYHIQPDAYGTTYYAELERKVNRLETVDGPRVVVVGGSSVAFGVDSKLVEIETGLPCVNFGLYAAFGLKPMLDLSLGRLHRGDIVVIAPETTAQMYSTYCGYDALLQAFEARSGLLIGLGPDYYPGLAAAVPGYARSARALRNRGGAHENGVYALSSFDPWGDIVYSRPENMMERGYIEDNLPQLQKEIVTDSFLDMINDYTRAAQRRGARVFFSFCPINELSLTHVGTAQPEAFTEALERGLDCPVLSPLSDHIMDAGYFYDSNYHLNTVGARYNTLMLIADLQRERGDVRAAGVAWPHPPAMRRDDAVTASGAENGIAYDVTGRGAVVTGLDEAARTRGILEIPRTLGGAEVIAVAAGALKGSAAIELVLPDTILSLPGRLFEGMDRLTAVSLMATSLPQVGDQLLSGARAGLVIRVPAALYGSYITDYFWGAYAGQVEAIG